MIKDKKLMWDVEERNKEFWNEMDRLLIAYSIMGFLVGMFIGGNLINLIYL